MDKIEGLFTGHPGIILAEFLLKCPEIERLLVTTHMIQGLIGLHQAALLILLAQQYNAQDAWFCNIGTFHGYSTALLAKAAPDAHIVSLDPNPKRARLARKNLRGLSNVEILEIKSWDYEGSGWDLVFVDGAHRECKRDIVYYDRLLPGGIILFHDYVNHKFPEVQQAINGLLRRLGKDRPDIEVLANGCGGMAGVYKDS